MEGLNSILETVSSGGDWTSTSFMGLWLVVATAVVAAGAAPNTLRVGCAAPKLVAPNIVLELFNNMLML